MKFVTAASDVDGIIESGNCFAPIVLPHFQGYEDMDG